MEKQDKTWKQFVFDASDGKKVSVCDRVGGR